MVKPKKASSNPHAVVSPRLPFQHKKILIILGVVIVLAIVGTTIGLIIAHHDENVVPLGEECSASSRQYILREAAPLTRTQSTVAQTRLESIVNMIQGISNYQQDPNCLYPIVIYYINTSDSKDASLYMSKLNKVYNPKEGFNESIEKGGFYNITALKAEVAFLAQSKGSSYNSYTFGSPNQKK